MGSPFLPLRKHSLWEKEKVKDMRISDKDKTSFYNYDFLIDNDEKSEITISLKK